MIYTSVIIRDFWTVTFEHTNLRFSAYDDVTSYFNLCSVKIPYYGTCLYTLWFIHNFYKKSGLFAPAFFFVKVPPPFFPFLTYQTFNRNISVCQLLWGAPRILRYVRFRSIYIIHIFIIFLYLFCFGPVYPRYRIKLADKEHYHLE